MPAYEAREQPLLLARKTRHICMLEQVRTMLVIAGVRYIEADLVQPSSPREQLLSERIIELPALGDLR